MEFYRYRNRDEEFKDRAYRLALQQSGGRPVVSSPSPSTLLDGLVAHWKMDEESGTRVDATGNGYDLIPYLGNIDAPGGSVGSDSGKFGLAAKLIDDPSDAVLLGNANFSPNIAAGITAALWVKTNEWSSEFYGSQSSDPIFINGLFEGNPTSLKMAINSKSDGTIFLSCNVNPDVLPEDCITIPTPQTFNLMFLIWQDSNLWLALNDQDPVLMYSEGSPTPTPHVPTFLSLDSLTSLLLGAPNYNNNTDLMLLDSVSFWNRVLTPEERSALYNAGAGLDYPFV